MAAVLGHTSNIIAEDMAEPSDKKNSHKEDEGTQVDEAGRADDSAATLSPGPKRPTFPHKKSASIDSKASSYSGIHRTDSSTQSTYPLSPPLPPASFNPPPDIHPLLLAAATRTESDEIITGPHYEKREPCDIPNVVSPLTELSPNGGLSSVLGPSVTNPLPPAISPYFAATPPRKTSASNSFSSVPTPNTMSAHTSPFHFAEFQSEVGMLQRRLSQDRRRRSSGLSLRREGRERAAGVAEEVENDGGVKAADGPEGGRRGSFTLEPNQHSERSGPVDAEESGTEHLRGARQELQAVLEEAMAEMPLRCEDGSHVQEPLESDEASSSQTNVQGSPVPEAESIFASPQFAPVFSPASGSQPNAPLSFEDIVRHTRRGSISTSGQLPAYTPNGSGPGSPAGPSRDHPEISYSRSRKTSMTGHSSETIRVASPTASRRASVVELTKMRRTFSGEEGRSRDEGTSASEAARTEKPEIGCTVQGVVAPASILQFLGSQEGGNTNTTTTYATETDMAQVDKGLRGLVLEGSSRENPGEAQSHTRNENYDPRSDPAVPPAVTLLDASPSSQSDSENVHTPDTHLWDSVWPSATSPTHIPASTGVSFPKPMSDSRGTLTLQLPMHSRTSSMSMSSISESNSPSPYSSPNQGMPMPPIHSLSFPRTHLSRPNEPPVPAQSTYHRTGIPLFFSEALTNPSAPSWLQHPSARRGSIASLGAWPLKRNNTTAVTETVGEDAPERSGSIQEENVTMAGLEERSSDKTDDTRQTVEA